MQYFSLYSIIVSGNGDLPLVDIESRLGGAAAAAANHRNSRRKRKHSPDESTASDASAPIDPLSDLVFFVVQGIEVPGSLGLVRLT